MEEEIKNLLNCGYYDDSANHIIELNEEKMKDFFKKFFKVDTVIFANKDMEKIKKENQDLKEKFDCTIDDYIEENQTLKEELKKVKYNADKIAHEIMDEQEKRYQELKEKGKAMIKAFAEYL